jgi:hypothetical protein
MAFGTGFRGTTGGSVQSTYTDQPGQALDGMLAFASDIALCDSIYIDQANGIAAGRGVKVAAVSDSISLQRPNIAASLPANGAAATDFYGILIFDEQMQSDANGVPGISDGRMGLVLRNARAGGRIYVKCPEAIVVGTSTVNWVTVAGSDGLYEAGQFAPAALAGNSTYGTSVLLPTAAWVQGCSAGGYAIVELNPLPSHSH